MSWLQTRASDLMFQTRRYGGATLDPNGTPVTSGCVVARRRFGAAPMSDSEAVVGLAVAAVAETTVRGEFLGAWLDERTGMVHIDAVDVVTDPNEAERLARLRGELAWYDLDSGTEHRIEEACAPGAP